MPKNLKYYLLGVYLILAGLAAFGLTFPYFGFIMGVIAIVAGILFFFP